MQNLQMFILSALVAGCGQGGNDDPDIVPFDMSTEDGFRDAFITRVTTLCETTAETDGTTRLDNLGGCDQAPEVFADRILVDGCRYAESGGQECIDAIDEHGWGDETPEDEAQFAGELTYGWTPPCDPWTVCGYSE